MDWQFKVGLGVALVFGLLPFAVKNMPTFVTWIGISIGLFLILWGIIPHKKGVMASNSETLTIKTSGRWMRLFGRPTVIKPIVFNDDKTLIPLTEAVDKLRKEGKKQTTLGYSMDIISKMKNIDKEFDRLARLLAEQIDVYGKQPSSSFENWIKISGDIIDGGNFKKLASELYIRNYIDRGPEFIDLAIKKDELDKAITDILSSNRIYAG